MSYEPSLEEYIHQLSHDPKPSVRQNAAFILGRWRDLRVVPPLIAAVQDEDPGVRMRAVEALGVWKHMPETVQAVIPALGDADEAVRSQAARALGLMQDVDAVPALLEALNDTSVAVRAKTAEALGVLAQPAAIMALLRALIEDDDSGVRYFAQESLVQIGGAAVRESVSEAIQQYYDEPGILIDLISVLAKLRDSRNIEVLRPLLAHPHEDVTAMAQWAITEQSH